MQANNNTVGYVAFTLHSHLPYVVHHGTWPHGLDWLHEAAAETYLPFLRLCKQLEEEGLALKATVNLSPVLLEQLSHPTFQSGFAGYTQQKIEAAREDARFFSQRGETHYVEVAKFWEGYYQTAQQQFDELERDLVAGFRKYYDSGAIEIITCAATHGYFPLLGTDASIRAQVRLGVETHQRFFGRKPRGIWLPECAYRPAGTWHYPVAVNGALGGRPTSWRRAGVEQLLAESGLEYFFVDTHLVEFHTRFTPYELLAGDVPVAVEEEEGEPRASFYRPYFADTLGAGRSQVAFFTRDPRTGLQVWSGDHGYPGTSEYLDFHKKRWPGGHRYWQVTSPKIDLAYKLPYYPKSALSGTLGQAEHFAGLVRGVLERAAGTNGSPPVLSAPFDAELFGHWWFEGPQWLMNVARVFARPGSGVELITCGEYLEKHRPNAYLGLPEGSWGRNGTHEVWLNPDTEWTWKQIYPAELEVQRMAESGRWRESEIAGRLARQMCRELMLLESSDWQFLITTGSARDYAEQRFLTHLGQFQALLDAWRRYESAGSLDEHDTHKLEEIEARDSIFPTMRPELYLKA